MKYIAFLLTIAITCQLLE